MRKPREVRGCPYGEGSLVSKGRTAYCMEEGGCRGLKSVEAWGGMRGHWWWEVGGETGCIEKEY